MSTTATQTIEAPLATLYLNTGEIKPEEERTAKGRPPADYKYARFLPSYDQSLKLPPLEPFEHVDPGLAALKDEKPRAFLDSAEVKNLTPNFGSEVSGIQLSKLDQHAKSQLALYVAQRGVVVFREQDFVDQSPEWQLNDWGKTFGRLHVHPTSGQPEGYPNFHLVYKDDSRKGFGGYNPNKLSSSGWHSDVTYEEQPPGLTTLFLYATPDTGGDTAFLSQVAAYNRLSPSFQAYLETLQVVHSGVAQADFSRAGNRGGVIKREPVENVHPLVRRHPVTGEKALFVNRQFSRHIVGLKTEESEAIMNLLYTHIAQGLDFQVRARWEPRSVVLWDNRVTCHSAIGDFDASFSGFRHGARITPQAERPTL